MNKEIKNLKSNAPIMPCWACPAGKKRKCATAADVCNEYMDYEHAKAQARITEAEAIIAAGRRLMNDEAADESANIISAVPDVEAAAFLADAAITDTTTTDDNKEVNTMTTSIKFFWNGIKVNGERKLIKCMYSLDNQTDGRECVTIYADRYTDKLPGDMFAVWNDTDIMTDYFETDSAVLYPGHPLYAYARAAAVKSALHYANKHFTYCIERGNASPYRAAQYAEELERTQMRIDAYEAELAVLPKTHPTAADVEAVHAMNLAAETARLAAEHEREIQEREEALKQRNEGREYIRRIAAEHPITDGEPVVTIQWSEHPAFSAWRDSELKLSATAAEIILKHYDEERAAQNEAEGHGGYDKTSFVIAYINEDGEESTYEGRYDLGDNDGGLIAHIRAFAEWKRRPGYCQDVEAADAIAALADLLVKFTAGGQPEEPETPADAAIAAKTNKKIIEFPGASANALTTGGDYMKEILRSLKSRSAWYGEAIGMAKREKPWKNGFNWPLPADVLSPFDPLNIPYWEGAKRELDNAIDMVEAALKREGLTA